MTPKNPNGYADREATQPPDWHGLVVWDVFLNALTTGLFLVTAIGELARPELFEAVARWAYPAALVFLLADLACLVFDLGHPSRFHHMLRVFKPLSPMSLGTWFLTAYSLPLTLLVAVDVAGVIGWTIAEWVRYVLIGAGVPLAFGSAAYKGVLFSTSSQPGWRDARWLGAYHTSGAFVFGCAGLLVLATLTSDSRPAVQLRLALGVTLTLNLIVLWLLLRDLRRVPQVLPLATASVVLACGLLVIGNGMLTVVAAGVVFVAGFAVRSMVVRLPHASHS